MGSIRTVIGNLRDFITEQVACKAGLLLTDHEAHTVLARHECEDLSIFEGPREVGIRVRAEDVELLVADLRFGIGNLPSPTTGGLYLVQTLKELVKEGVDPGRMMEAIDEVVSIGLHLFAPNEAVEYVSLQCGLPKRVVTRLIAAFDGANDRGVSWEQMQQADIEWAIPLRALFDSEHIPEEPEAYLDQRYIDYFVSNSEDLSRMHWRNFERLTAEFFRRQGYDIRLGPGTKDGGVDVRAWPAGGGNLGPPLVIIQCKRLDRKNLVEVETVKAFWTDVDYERAGRGIIATTSRISPEGARISHARGWPLEFAEHRTVHEWVNSMWRHSPLADDDR